MKRLLFVVGVLFVVNSFAVNMSYVEVNSNSLSNVGCYVRASNNKPYFDMVSIFAANINGANPDYPKIYLNPQVKSTILSSQIKNLQNKGIKVLATLLGNHKNAGWSCMNNQLDIDKFANQVVEFANQYNLDGIDIDDEYSDCSTDDTSLIRIAEAIKTNPAFAGKLLTKALFSDKKYFKASYNGHKLADYLDYGWEMSYGSNDFDDRLSTYFHNGMTANKLMIGGWTQSSDPSPRDIGQYTANNNLAGVMVYDVNNNSQNYLSALAMGQYKDQIQVLPNCLQ